MPRRLGLELSRASRLSFLRLLIASAPLGSRGLARPGRPQTGGGSSVRQSVDLRRLGREELGSRGGHSGESFYGKRDARSISESMSDPVYTVAIT